MTKLIALISLFYITTSAQIIISPYVVYIDERERFGSYIVQNESNEEQEISVSFKFGYPASDSLGKGSMYYPEETEADTLPSVVNWIKAFPKKFVLPPKERQVIRMTVRPPDTVKPGTYWARIITSSTPRAENPSEETTGISAKINFVMNQVTTVLYRIDPAVTGVDVSNLRVENDSSGLHIYADLRRTGNTPFFGDLFVKLMDENNNAIDTLQEFIPLYFNLTKDMVFSSDSLNPGSYKAELKIIHNEKEDVVNSRLTDVPTIIKSIDFELP